MGALLAELEDTRTRTLALVERIDAPTLEALHSPIMSPLAWDLGHIAAFEDLWLSRRLGGLPLLRPELARTYDAFETPRAVRGGMRLLGAHESVGYLEQVRDRAREAVGGGSRPPRERSAELLELVLRHEQQHVETMLQTIELAHLDPGFLPAPTPDDDAPAAAGADCELVEVPGGPAALGADPESFAYDNERPRHPVELAPFSIARAPITNATWRHFAEGGGYVRREWWSDEGWAWKEEYDISAPGEWTDDGREWRAGEGLVPLEPHRPVVHLSWFEADAFARAHDARLPSESEWERAALGAQTGGANLDGDALGTLPSRAAAPSGCLALLGDVWEWTSSDFRGYPGFVADPYRQYSEPFFGPTHKVLRGGSWATATRVATPTHRNWDLPARRQIFSGLRIARDP